ncbi:MAG: ABC transporter permease [Anaerolineae bacterium]|nr:ABC transporter permease [Anaerolineae bacterium]
MFDDIVRMVVRQLTPYLKAVGDTVCAQTPGLAERWSTYEFMCRNTQALARQSIEHVILTLIAMIVAILLGVIIGLRVSSSPWPRRGSLLVWPIAILVVAVLLAGGVALATMPESLATVDAFRPADPGSWSQLLDAAPGNRTFALAVVLQAALVFGLAAVLVAGLLPGDTDLRLLPVALAGAILGPLVVPRPFLHTLLLQIYRLAQSAGLEGGTLRTLATVLNWVREAAPLWALLVLVLIFGRLSHRLTWQKVLAAALGGYVLGAILSAFVIRPGASTTILVLQLLLFAVFAMLMMLGERAADPVLYVVGIIFTIPSLAMFGIMIPIIGIGVDPAVVALTLYALLPILRNTITAMRQLNPSIIEAGRGMGMTDLQLLTRVQIPLALPIILAGVRVSTVMTVGIASIATLIGAGGLGELIFHGINRTNTRMVLTGAIWIALLALLFDYILGQGEIRWVSKGIRVEEGEEVEQVAEATAVSV